MVMERRLGIQVVPGGLEGGRAGVEVSLKLERDLPSVKGLEPFRSKPVLD